MLAEIFMRLWAYSRASCLYGSGLIRSWPRLKPKKRWNHTKSSYQAVFRQLCGVDGSNSWELILRQKWKYVCQSDKLPKNFYIFIGVECSVPACVFHIHDDEPYIWEPFACFTAKCQKTRTKKTFNAVTTNPSNTTTTKLVGKAA